MWAILGWVAGRSFAATCRDAAAWLPGAVDKVDLLQVLKCTPKSNKGSNPKEPLAKLSPTVAAFMYLENISKEKLNERFASLTVNRFARRGVAGRNNS